MRTSFYERDSIPKSVVAISKKIPYLDSLGGNGLRFIFGIVIIIILDADVLWMFYEFKRNILIKCFKIVTDYRKIWWSILGPEIIDYYFFIKLYLIDIIRLMYEKLFSKFQKIHWNLLTCLSGLQTFQIFVTK